ncbi:hypothetical protein F5Y03DRAFT_390301 [Xylaria venustula]|nr:hypothetical protein F5Y03DRAFT_390301 [Xylaria venustula]
MSVESLQATIAFLRTRLAAANAATAAAEERTASLAEENRALRAQIAASAVAPPSVSAAVAATYTHFNVLKRDTQKNWHAYWGFEGSAHKIVKNRSPRNARL